MKVLVVYNICGIRKKEQPDYYISAVESVLSQKFDDFHVIISGCLSSDPVKTILENHFGTRVSYNWITESYPVLITFNHAVRQGIREFGEFEGYLYIDSGVTFDSCYTDSNKPYDCKSVLQQMYSLLKSGKYAMVTARVDHDTGYQHWGIGIGKENYLIPVGKACNLHCQLFSHEVFEAYGNVLPDVFANNTSESVHSFVCAALKKQWVICHEPILHHITGMDGASSGWEWHGIELFPFTDLGSICEEGRQFGLGYEECKNLYMHDPDKFDENGHSLDDRLLPFIRKYLYLSKDQFDYDKIKHVFASSKAAYMSIPQTIQILEQKPTQPQNMPNKTFSIDDIKVVKDLLDRIGSNNMKQLIDILS